ncbi:MAG: homoserine dehydrogenase [Bacteroidales bacterium]|nr:homoserine dehydrogenase [Bacteroidales bacterium]MBD5362890.1 homoserine dehydrogenase [Bacteroides sp.]MBD5363686.1 homoserine dehydrogenase [Bacteroides sp.]MBD5372914.1 homoserine dehydrogenase [Bacteroides sp.]
MNGRKKLVIGLFGFGTVGRALHSLLETTRPDGVKIKRICVRDINKDRGIDASFTNNPDEIFNDPEINMVVELIDDASASYQIITRALREGKAAVSGNKKMLAVHLPELIDLQKETGATLLYDASACGSIPVIRNLEEYYDNELLISVKGILNGSSNYILTKVFNHGMTYAAALKEAQEAGFAESDPSLDVDGWDSLSKLIIITVHAFGTYIHPDKIFTFGISHMSQGDINFAREKNRRIKLVGHVEKLSDGRLIACVIPQLLSDNKYIYSVDDEFNGVVIKGLYYDKQFMFGRGAGGYPTGSAILSDITASQYDYKYEYKKRLTHPNDLPQFTNDVHFRVYYRYQSPEDLNLINFESISEKYISEGFNYVVGVTSLESLHKVASKLRERDVFVAAYPPD